MRYKSFVLLFLLVSVPNIAISANADLILYNGKIVTVDGAFTIAHAVAIRDGKIAAIGSTDSVLAAEKGAKTRLVNLEGKTVLPGLIDSHLHPLEAALSEWRGPLPRLDSFEAIRKFVKERAAVTPKGEWIVVPRTFPTRLQELQMPTKEVLDVAPNHPVMFDASYVVVANSYALKISGIDRNTPDPPRGVIVRDASGEPNGVLRNAKSLLKGLKPSEGFSAQEVRQALEKMLGLYQAAGLTSVGDGSTGSEALAVYRQLNEAHRLPVRIVMTHWVDIARPEADLIREIGTLNYKTNSGNDWLRWGAFKINIDGGMTIGTAYQREPYGPFGRQLYGQTDPTNRGQLFAQPEKSMAVLRAAHEKGWQLSAHCQGGGAIDVFLGILEALDKIRPVSPMRSHWIHASFQSTDAIQRARKIGVIADVQAAWLYLDAPALEKVFGDAGMRYFFPLRTYLDSGVIVAGGSDHMIGYDRNKAVNPFNPFIGMYCAVTRKTIRGNVVHPEERISRAEALKMYTIWAAHRQFAEKSKGSLEVGKLADMVVVDRDYLTCTEDQIKNIEPLMTVLDGKIVYTR